MCIQGRAYTVKIVHPLYRDKGVSRLFVLPIYLIGSAARSISHRNHSHRAESNWTVMLASPLCATRASTPAQQWFADSSPTYSFLQPHRTSFCTELCDGTYWIHHSPASNHSLIAFLQSRSGTDIVSSYKLRWAWMYARVGETAMVQRLLLVRNWLRPQQNTLEAQEHSWGNWLDLLFSTGCVVVNWPDPLFSTGCRVWLTRLWKVLESA